MIEVKILISWQKVCAQTMSMSIALSVYLKRIALIPDRDSALSFRSRSVPCVSLGIEGGDVLKP